MYKIFYNSRVLVLCSDSKEVKQPDAVYVCPAGSSLPKELPEIFRGDSIIKTIAVVTCNPEQTFNELRRNFKEITAAGGLVHNERGEFLLILRNGIWDLPKGKAEEGEMIQTTALREVGEECGLKGVTLGAPICITRHCYSLGDDFILKHTHWFHMECSSAEKLVPQTEEGIEQIKWVAKKDLHKYAELTYPSLREVMAAAE